MEDIQDSVNRCSDAHTTLSARPVTAFLEGYLTLLKMRQKVESRWLAAGCARSLVLNTPISLHEGRVSYLHKLTENCRSQTIEVIQILKISNN